MKTFVSVAALLAASAMSMPLRGSMPVRRAPISAELIAQLAPDLGAVPPLPPSGELSLFPTQPEILLTKNHFWQALAIAWVLLMDQTASLRMCHVLARQRGRRLSRCVHITTQAVACADLYLRLSLQTSLRAKPLTTPSSTLTFQWVTRTKTSRAASPPPQSHSKILLGLARAAHLFRPLSE
jgi:hypothetical protein